MIFLIFTSSDLYLGIRGRIHEFLPLNGRNSLKLDSYVLPQDLGKILSLVAESVEKYYDRINKTAPEGLSLRVIYSPHTSSSIIDQIENRFTDYLLSGWTWESGHAIDTNVLETARDTDRTLALRRLIRTVNQGISNDKEVIWHDYSAVNSRLLELNSEYSSAPSMRNNWLLFINQLKSPIAILSRRLAALRLPLVSLPRPNYILLLPLLIVLSGSAYLLWSFKGMDVPGKQEIGEIPATSYSGIIAVNDQTAEVADSSFIAKEPPVEPETIDSVSEVEADVAAAQLTEANTVSTGSTSRYRAANNVLSTDTNSIESNLSLLRSEPTIENESQSLNKNTEQSTDSETLSEAKKESVLARLNQSASFPGGELSLIQYLRNNIQYPKAAKRKKIEGEVEVRFEIDVEGQIHKIEVINGLGFGCDDEAVRLITNMPSWKPATEMRKRIPTTMTINIPFYLN